MSRKIGLFLTRLTTNPYKDLFIIRLGVNLLLSKLKITGPLVKPLDFLLRSVLGLMAEQGIFQIELSIDAIKEGIKLKEFEKEAQKAYKKATEKVYSEQDKEKIRQQYLDIISSIGHLGDIKPPDNGLHGLGENS